MIYLFQVHSVRENQQMSHHGAEANPYSLLTCTGTTLTNSKIHALRKSPYGRKLLRDLIPKVTNSIPNKQRGGGKPWFRDTVKRKTTTKQLGNQGRLSSLRMNLTASQQRDTTLLLFILCRHCLLHSQRPSLKICILLIQVSHQAKHHQQKGKEKQHPLKL